MKRGPFVAIGIAMAAVAATVRLNNAFAFPSLRGYDGFSHFTYIWFMATQWRVPLPTTGWAFFHPPLYYALMATIWQLLAPADPVLRLKAGTALIALLGLTHAAVSYAIVRRYFPGDRLLHLLAPGLMLFLPVHLYTAGFLGNEGLNAILCSLALLALLAVLRTPTSGRALALGLCLGLAMLTKFTAVAVVAGALGTIALRTLLHHDWHSGLRTLVLVTSVLLLVCGWFYARNLQLYGTPFKMSRDQLMLQRVENLQIQGKRTFLEFVLFDPVVLRRPQWPRGLPLDGGRPPGSTYSALRESVLTGLYANTWFDGFGGWVLPPVTASEAARRAGQALLTLALVPSGLVVAGVWTALRRLWREGWDDTLVAMLLTFGAMAAIFVEGMRVVPMHAAVKATYVTPVSVIFSFWFALGFDRVSRWRTWPRPGIAMLCAVLAAVSATVFLQDRIIMPGWLAKGMSSPVWQNAYGVVYYAGGDRTRARQLFATAVEGNWHLAHENLAALAIEDDRPLEALHHLRQAMRLQPKQTAGLPRDRRRFNRATQAEYQNLMAVICYRLAWLDVARQAARRATVLNPRLPEAHYDLATLTLIDALADAETAAVDPPQRPILLAQARHHLQTAVLLDPAFTEAWALLATVSAMTGDCDRAREHLARAETPASGQRRRYPIETGRGDLHAAAIHRRRHITPLPPALDPWARTAACANTRGQDT